MRLLQNVLGVFYLCVILKFKYIINFRKVNLCCISSKIRAKFIEIFEHKTWYDTILLALCSVCGKVFLLLVKTNRLTWTSNPLNENIFHVAIGQTFYDLHTRLHLFNLISHATRQARCNFLLVCSVISCILWATISCKHMWVQV